jgi:hypothetical protein
MPNLLIIVYSRAGGWGHGWGATKKLIDFKALGEKRYFIKK